MIVERLVVSGEVPGLYTPEELEPLLSPLKDAASQDGFTGPLYNYFSHSQYFLCIVVHSLSVQYIWPYVLVLSGKVSYCIISLH